MRFELEAYDWNGTAHVSHLSMRGLFGLMKMDTLICTPYAKDMPLFSYDFIRAFGRKTQVRQKLSLAEAEDITMAIL